MKAKRIFNPAAGDPGNFYRRGSCSKCCAICSHDIQAEVLLVTGPSPRCTKSQSGCRRCKIVVSPGVMAPLRPSRLELVGSPGGGHRPTGTRDDLALSFSHIAEAVALHRQGRQLKIDVRGRCVTATKATVSWKPASSVWASTVRRQHPAR